MRKTIPIDAVLIPDHAQLVFEGILHDVYQWQQELFDGKVATFEMIHRPDTALVIGIEDGQAIIVVDDQPHRGEMVGFPGGRVDHSDQSTLSAAKREMLEETGLEFENWRLITVVQPSRKTEYFVYAYVAWGVTSRSQPVHDSGETIKIEYVGFDELIERTKHHELPDAIRLLESAGSVDGIMQLPDYDGIDIVRPPKVERS